MSSYLQCFLLPCSLGPNLKVFFDLKVKVFHLVLITFNHKYGDFSIFMRVTILFLSSRVSLYGCNISFWQVSNSKMIFNPFGILALGQKWALTKSTLGAWWSHEIALYLKCRFEV
jgi:hypothetical protein